MAILTPFRHRFYNNDGTVASGGKVYIYEPGTSTLKNSYTTSSGAVANTNPIILDSKGEADIWTSGTFKANLLQYDDVQVTGYPVDNLGAGQSSYDIAGFQSGVPTSSQIILRLPMVRQVSFGVNMVGSRGSASVAATASTTFTEPGERWAYSNTNYKALALVAERAAGQPFDTVLAERVLRPAGLAAVGPCHDLGPGGFVAGYAPTGKLAPLDASRAAYAGDGVLCASAVGLVDWLRKGSVDREGVPPRLARLAVPTRLMSGRVVPYGFGLSTREFLGHRMIWHAGNVDGHSALVAHAPGDDRSIVILTNRGFVRRISLLSRSS